MPKPTSDDLRNQFLAADRAMHVVWTKAVGTDGYDKSLWIELSKEIGKLYSIADECLRERA